MKRRALAGAIPALVLLAACDIPSEVPQWDMTWNVPVQNTTISVVEFLPNNVSSIDASTFRVNNIAGASVTRTLAQDCSDCVAANGLTAPKPAFTGTGTATAALPSGVTSVTLTGADSLILTITNGFNFDPIRPAAGTFGWARTVVTSGGVQIGKDSVNGAQFAIPGGGGTLRRAIPLSGTVAGTGLTVTVTFFSPAGDPVLINTSQSITFAGTAKAGATSGALLISSAKVSLANESVSSTSTLELGDIDESVKKRVNSATLFLTVTNPLAASGSLTINFTGGDIPVSKTISLPTGPITNTALAPVTFTKTEIQALLGHNITMTYSGGVTGTPDVTPAQQVKVDARMQLNISTKAE